MQQLMQQLRALRHTPIPHIGKRTEKDKNEPPIELKHTAIMAQSETPPPPPTPEGGGGGGMGDFSEFFPGKVSMSKQNPCD